jgi:predicted dehydrogenase
MRKKVRWGVLGVAKIATAKVIPAMQQSAILEISAIASRDLQRAETAARQLGIAKAYGSYEELLADPEIDAIYNPLPNHLHVPLSIDAARAGKHVLCEKPIGLTSDECRTLIAERDRTGVQIGEAFMIRSHPQWLRTRELVRAGRIGELRSLVGSFSYFNRDPKNIRNKPEWGGGALMDIGCYPIQAARFLFERQPGRVCGVLERDPEFGTDRLTSAVLDFGTGHCVFSCGTQMVPYQRLQILGTTGRIELEIPFNAPPDQSVRLFVDDGSSLGGASAIPQEFPVCDQYLLQGDAFSRAILGEGAVPTPLEDSLGNMQVIEALQESSRTEQWIRMDRLGEASTGN